MEKVIAITSLIAMVASLPLAILRPSWVFYIFLTSVVFGKILYASIFAVGALGAARTWQPADFLFFTTCLAAFFVRKDNPYPRNAIKTCLYIVVGLAAFSLFQGFVLNGPEALPASRRVYFVAAMIFALKYFTDVEKVNEFLKFGSILLVSMFVMHVLLRFGIFVPGEEFQRTAGQLVGERGELLLSPPLYLALVSIGVARLATKTGKNLYSFVMLFAGLAGVGLAESRTLHGGVAVIGLLSLLFVRGRAKTILVLGLCLVIGFWLAAKVGLTVAARWQTGAEGTFEGIILDTWRQMEYPAILRSYYRQPYLIFTGRGVGATHFIPAAEATEGMVSYFHSEFLGWLDMMGLIGLASLLIFWGKTWRESLRLLRTRQTHLTFYGSTVFMLMTALFLHSIFSPSFMSEKSASVFICFVVIIANWREIYSNSFGDQETGWAGELPAEDYAGDYAEDVTTTPNDNQADFQL